MLSRKKNHGFCKCISMDFGNDFQFLEMDFQDFGNGFSIFGNAFSIFGNGFSIFGNAFSIFGNGFPRFWKWIFNFWKWISKILEMHFQFLEMDFQFGDVFQCIFLNLSNEFLVKKNIILIKKLYNFNNFYIFVKNVNIYIKSFYGLGCTAAIAALNSGDIS
jgi:hypothetical protein